MTIKIYENLEQRSDEWLEARRGILTASQIGQLITPSRLQPASNDKSRALVNQLVAERITGLIEETYISADMQRGIWDEPYAKAAYEQYTNVTVKEVGFITKTIDGNTIGYSPDGLVGDDGLIEIKSRRPLHQLATWRAGEVPAYHMAQIQTGLYVTERAWCDYISFAGGMALFVKRVHPDKGWHTAIEKTLHHFEQQATEILTEYQQATDGYPIAELTTQPDEIEI